MGSGNLVITTLEAADVAPAAALLSSAMSTNPMHVAVFGGQDETTRRRQQEMFAVLLQEFPGERFVAKRAGEIVGFLRVVRSPDCQLPPWEALRLAPTLRRILGESASRVAEWFTVWARHDPHEDHWHLGPVAVAVDCQGQGIGSALIRHSCEYVDRHGEPIHLETDKIENVGLYERFGFSTREEIEIFGVRNFFMWRQAR